MKFKLEIDCDNAAFEDDAGAEVIAILKRLIEKVESGRLDSFPLYDTNGNRVGFAEFVN